MTKAALSVLSVLALGFAGIATWQALDGDERDTTGATTPPAPAAPPPAASIPVAPGAPAKVIAKPPADVVAASVPADAEPKDDARTLDQSGRAQLAQGIEARRDGRGAQARALFEGAANALGQAIALGGERVDPWTLENMAQAQLELGNDVDAIAWADRALQRVRSGNGDDYETFRSATLTMNVGIVYFRAGQRQTGIAYMDQAISMAPTAFDRADFSDLKEETIGGG